MPKFPQYADRIQPLTGSVFERFRPKMDVQGDDLVKLHIGDSYAQPPYDLPIDPDFKKNHPRFNRYCDTFGIHPLREALAEKVRTDNGLEAGANNILVTCGVTNALSISMQSLVNPGEEVLVLSPYWPFFRGMVIMAGGRPVEVPFYMRLYDEPAMDIDGHLDRYISADTVALYINTPNNPSGKVLNEAQLRRIADFAGRHRLWVISDEAYDGMTYDDHVHRSIGSFPGMFERTLSMFTFSKVYMFSGLRLGYVVAPEDVVGNLNKAMVHQLYSPSTLAQQMMVEAVKTRSQWCGAFVKHCRELRDMFVAGLKISTGVPEGAYYFFFPIDGYMNGRNYWDVIDACLENGVSVAPGEDFGVGYRDYVRICFAGEPPNRLAAAIERLNEIFPG
jgi:N-succinyldiaminopimelate aminotransferase